MLELYCCAFTQLTSSFRCGYGYGRPVVFVPHVDEQRRQTRFGAEPIYDVYLRGRRTFVIIAKQRFGLNSNTHVWTNCLLKIRNARVLCDDCVFKNAHAHGATLISSVWCLVLSNRNQQVKVKRNERMPAMLYCVT